MNSKQLTCCIALILAPLSGIAEEGGDWFLRATVGASMLDDQSSDLGSNPESINGADVAIDSGFTSGLGVGYQFSEAWSVELYWEYRSHDAETTLFNGEVYDDGNYASNIFYLNGNYRWVGDSPWTPYVGAGIGWIEEIDIDIERSGEPERSFSDNGYVGYQLYAGIDYEISSNWYIQGELRYSVFDDIDLDEESGNGSFDGLDYDPFTAQVGVVYRF